MPGEEPPLMSKNLAPRMRSDPELRQTATPGDVILSDGKFSSSSGTVEPENVDRRSDHPPYAHNNGGSGVRGIEYVSGIVKCAGCDGLLETFKPT